MDPTWDLSFEKIWTGTEVPKFSTFSPKKAPYEGLIFLIWCFCDFATLPGIREGEKMYPDQRHIPVTNFVLIPPGIYFSSH